MKFLSIKEKKRQTVNDIELFCQSTMSRYTIMLNHQILNSPRRGYRTCFWQVVASSFDLTLNFRPHYLKIGLMLVTVVSSSPLHTTVPYAILKTVVTRLTFIFYGLTLTLGTTVNKL